jgi:hypothetical protein
VQWEGGIFLLVQPLNTRETEVPLLGALNSSYNSMKITTNVTNADAAVDNVMVQKDCAFQFHCAPVFVVDVICESVETSHDGRTSFSAYCNACKYFCT